MNYAAETINPYYAARLHRPPAAPSATAKCRPIYARLPLAPITASPVPELTSLYHNTEAGEYGDRSYPGNCSGNLIKDVLRFFKPARVYDPMTGSGTCRDVCKELGAQRLSASLNSAPGIVEALTKDAPEWCSTPFGITEFGT